MEALGRGVVLLLSVLLVLVLIILLLLLDQCSLHKEQRNSSGEVGYVLNTRDVTSELMGITPGTTNFSLSL